MFSVGRGGGFTSSRLSLACVTPSESTCDEVTSGEPELGDVDDWPNLTFNSAGAFVESAVDKACS